MALEIIITIIGIAILPTYIKEKINSYSVKGLILKTIASCVFMALAFGAAFKNPGNEFVLFIIIGLFLGVLGDVWLDLKYVYRNDDKPYTYAGFIFFGIGHLFFWVGLIRNYYDLSRVAGLIVAIIFSIIIGIIIVLLGPVLKLDYGKYKLISMCYAPLLIGTTLITFVICLQNSFTCLEMNVMLVGGVLFLLSDLVLSGTYFGGKERPIDIILNYIFYYGAQYVIAWAAFLSCR